LQQQPCGRRCSASDPTATVSIVLASPFNTRHIRSTGGTAFYVQPTEAWWSRQGAERLDATARHLVHAARVTAGQQLPPGSTSQPIPVAWFFGLFLLSAGYLWSLRRTG